METRFQKPLWAELFVRCSLPSTLRRPSRRRPPSQTGCRPEARSRPRMRHVQFTHTQRGSQLEDLHPLCVLRSQSETSPCGTSSCCCPVCLDGEKKKRAILFLHTSPPLSGSDPDGLVRLLSFLHGLPFPSLTFQSEDAISQGVHDVIERSFIGHVEKVLLFGGTGDRLDLCDERLWVLLPADVMTQNLEASVRQRARKKDDGLSCAEQGGGNRAHVSERRFVNEQ